MHVQSRRQDGDEISENGHSSLIKMLFSLSFSYGYQFAKVCSAAM